MAFIHISDGNIEKMLNQSQMESPGEACGILAGWTEDNEVWISRVYPCQNTHLNPTVEFLISPEDQVRIFQEIDDEEEIDLLGFYHSHPQGPNEPSQIDTSRNYWPDYLLAIVSLSPKPNISFWKWKDGRFLLQQVVRESF